MRAVNARSSAPSSSHINQPAVPAYAAHIADCHPSPQPPPVLTRCAYASERISRTVRSVASAVETPPDAAGSYAPVRNATASANASLAAARTGISLVPPRSKNRLSLSKPLADHHVVLV
jgi:hypothetical protein